MYHEVLVVGPFEVNCYLIASDPSQTVVLVDPGADADRIVAAVERSGRALEAILLTHGHVDHVGAVASVRRRWSVPVYIHPADAVWAFSDVNTIPPWYSVPDPVGARDQRHVQDGDEFELAGLRWKVIATPGHTPGGVCYHVPSEDCLWTGDTLFHGSVGRTDLPGGHPQQLQLSLRRLLDLPASTRVFPGHGPVTSLDMERRINPFL